MEDVRAKVVFFLKQKHQYFYLNELIHRPMFVKMFACNYLKNIDRNITCRQNFAAITQQLLRRYVIDGVLGVVGHSICAYQFKIAFKINKR